MIALIQRVRKAEVFVNDESISKIENGMLVFAGIMSDDTFSDLEYCAKKCSELRIFEDKNGLMNLGIRDIDGEMLVVSQFTLAASVRKGRRPSFEKAMKPPQAETMFDHFVDIVNNTGISVKKGVFGAKMSVELVNDGPVTIIIDSRD